MYSTKSFCNIVAFASQEPGIVSPIGELTTYAKTFTKELGFYRHSTLERYELLNFKSINNTTAVTVPQTNVDQAIAFVDFVTKLTQATSGELYYDEVLTQLQTLAGTLNANSVTIGAMVHSGAWWVPEWISWSDTSNATANIHKVWLSLPAFVTQYTDYEIVVVPPIDGLDQFFNPGDVVEQLIKTITTSQIMERVELSKAGFPETIIRSDPYQYNDPVTLSRKIDVTWTVLIYGPGGNDPDLIRDALVEYILANSNRPKEDWAVIFPDIFKRTEFILAPLWNQFAIPQRVLAQGIYSPIVDNRKGEQFLVANAPGYTGDHIVTESQLLGFPYRSLQIATIGSIENKDGKVKVSDYFADYINVGTDSPDFSRMSAETQRWVIMLARLVTIAETVTSTTDLPQGIYRITRDNKIFVAQTFNRILYLVLAKNSVA